MRAPLFRGVLHVTALTLLVLPALGCPPRADDGETEAAAGAEPARTGAGPAALLEGTWRLVERELPDGTVATPPQVDGVFTLAGGIRNFNVFWQNAEGAKFSYSVVSDYELTETDYTETIRFAVMNDEISGGGLSYELSRPTRTVPVTLEEGVLSFDLPFDPVTATVEGDALTASAEDGSFVDRWVRVK